jgi:hypothetical protein
MTIKSLTLANCIYMTGIAYVCVCSITSTQNSTQEFNSYLTGNTDNVGQETMDVCCDNHTTRINILCVENEDFMYVETSGIHNYHCLLMG